MARYTGAVCRLCRRTGEKLLLKGDRCLTPKCAVERRAAPSRQRQFGARRRRVSERGLQLREKQRARYVYGLLERQFRRLYDEAKRSPGATGDNLKVLLERRLDNVIYRLGFASSHAKARQLVLHGHLSLNGHRMNIPSYMVREGDIITWQENKKGALFEQATQDVTGKDIPGWLSLNSETMESNVSRLPTYEDTLDMIDGKAIVAYYSR
ncbi:30S ribosomal protein S4 [Chloroflexota bacterium]